MARTVSYAIIQLRSHFARAESLNVGLALFTDTGLDVRLARRLDKVRAISAALDVDSFRSNLLAIAEVDRLLVEHGTTSAQDRRNELHDLGYVSLSDIASFECASPGLYEPTIARLIELMVDPEPAAVRPGRSRTRLLSMVKKSLKKERILGRHGDDLGNHQLVPDVELAEGLVADFLLKNGCMHVVETVDVSSDEVSRQKIVRDIATSALIFEQARMSFGANDTCARLIYDASATIEKVAMPSLRAAEHQGAELINWRSGDDQRRLLVRLSELAKPTELKTGSHSPRFITSNQSRLKLN